MIAFPLRNGQQHNEIEMMTDMQNESNVMKVKAFWIPRRKLMEKLNPISKISKMKMKKELKEKPTTSDQQMLNVDIFVALVMYTEKKEQKNNNNTKWCST